MQCFVPYYLHYRIFRCGTSEKREGEKGYFGNPAHFLFCKELVKKGDKGGKKVYNNKVVYKVNHLPFTVRVRSSFVIVT